MTYEPHPPVLATRKLRVGEGPGGGPRVVQLTPEVPLGPSSGSIWGYSRDHDHLLEEFRCLGAKGRGILLGKGVCDSSQ